MLFESIRPARRKRRRAVLGGVVIAGATLVGGLAPSSPASAATGTWEVDTWRHFCGESQEVGSDEIYVYNIWFRFQPGSAASVQVGRKSIGFIDDIDDEEYHGLDNEHGQARFTGLHNFGLNAWSGGEFIQNRGPEVVGMITQVMEYDGSDTDQRRRTADGLVAGLKTELRALASLTGPLTVLGAAAGAAIGDALSGQNMNSDRSNALKSYLTGAVVNVALTTVRKAGFWSVLRSTLEDDVIGSPKISLFVSTDNFTASLIDPSLTSMSTDGHMFGSLRTRDWRQTFQDSDTRYVLDVHTGPTA